MEELHKNAGILDNMINFPSFSPSLEFGSIPQSVIYLSNFSIFSQLNSNFSNAGNRSENQPGTS